VARSIAWVLTLIVLSGGAAGLGAAEEKGLKQISLYYKVPSKQPLVYSSTMQEEDQSNLKGQSEKSSLRSEQTITNQYKLVGPETLAVKVQFSDLRTTVNGKEVDYTPPQKEAQRLMDIKGYRKTADKKASDFDKFDVILPGSPVGIGDSWTYTAPPTSDLPLYLITRFTLARLDKVNGRAVAIINAQTHASEVENARRLKITVHAKGRIGFAYEEGILVHSSFKVEMVTEPLDGTGKKMTKNIKTSMKLVKVD